MAPHQGEGAPLLRVDERGFFVGVSIKSPAVQWTMPMKRLRVYALGL
jgi:hypothetical protein